MLTCRYVGGGASEIGDREYEAIGQYGEFSEEQFSSIIRGGAAFLPESEFDKVGFTQEELDLSGPFGSRDSGDANFQAKLAAAQAAYADIRNRIIAGEPISSIVGSQEPAEVPQQVQPRSAGTRSEPAQRSLKDESKAADQQPPADPLFGRQDS
jgi:hypothetical protein